MRRTDVRKSETDKSRFTASWKEKTVSSFNLPVCLPAYSRIFFFFFFFFCPVLPLLVFVSHAHIFLAPLAQFLERDVDSISDRIFFSLFKVYQYRRVGSRVVFFCHKTASQVSQPDAGLSCLRRCHW